VYLAIEFAYDIEATIDAINGLLDHDEVKFEQEKLVNDEWLHIVQHKYIIDKLLFGEKIPLGSKNQAEDNLFEALEVSKEVVVIEVENEAQGGKALISEQKEQKQYGSANIFNLNIDFQCAGKQDDYEERVKVI